MEQKFDGPPPQAEIRLDGTRVVRTDVKGDWGLLLRWYISKEGKQVVAPNARVAYDFDLASLEPGAYEIVLQMWHYKDYRKDPTTREFVNSKFIEVSNKLAYTVAPAAGTPVAEAPAAAATEPAAVAAGAGQ
jgi:hypothetical protein